VSGLIGPSPARAADGKVAIGHYKWNTPVVHVDLGQHVTWYWVGPDTMHSVTGDSSNDTSIDSDPNTALPDHTVGDHFQVTFTQPGVYQFHCKLHPSVHGEVIVSATPGNPLDDPDPTPKPNVELLHPQVTDLSLAPGRFGLKGTTLHFALNDSALLDAEIWHARPDGRRGTYAGWEAWHGHLGFNEVNFAHRGPHLRHFTPRPGRYIAYLQATDSFHNFSGTRRLPFTIRAPRQP
jgi:plastocyanin